MKPEGFAKVIPPPPASNPIQTAVQSVHTYPHSQPQPRAHLQRMDMDEAGPTNPGRATPSLPETSPSSAPGDTPRPAPYGHACTNCVKTKCRCIMRGPGMSCERCHRLSKPCLPATYTRKRGSKRQTRTAQLEEKLEDLVSLLKSQQDKPATSPCHTHAHSHGSPSSVEGAAPPAHVHSHPHPHSHTHAHAHSHSHAHTHAADAIRAGLPFSCSSLRAANGLMSPAATHSTSTSVACNSPPSCQQPRPEDLSNEELETCLEMFKRIHLSYMPFVSIPENTTAKELKDKRPFFFMCILACTHKVTLTRFAICDRIREVLGQKILVSNERSIDLLLGLITILAWSIYQARGKPFNWMFCHIAMAMAGDLGLDRPIQLEKGDAKFSFTGRCHGGLVSRNLNHEERRAVLACFIICSSIGGFLQRPNPMHWSPLLQQCLDVLHAAQDTPRDQLLIAQVQMQRLLDDIAQTPWRSSETSHDMNIEISPAFYIKIFLNRLQDIMLGVSDPEIAQSRILRITRQAVEIAIRELILHASPSAVVNGGNPDVTRIDLLYNCLHAVKGWFDEFFSFPVADYAGITFNIFSGLAIGFQTLYRLSVLDTPGWDRAAVRSTASLLDLLDRCADNIAQVTVVVGIDTTGVEDGDVFSRAARLVRNQRANCAQALEQVGAAAAHAEGAAASAANVNMAEFQQLLDSHPDSWLVDMFAGPWDGI